MTCEDEQDIEEEAPDCLGSRLLVLRDVMAGYDTSHILDVRDPWFQSLLDEALGLLGLKRRVAERRALFCVQTQGKGVGVVQAERRGGDENLLF